MYCGGLEASRDVLGGSTWLEWQEEINQLRQDQKLLTEIGQERTMGLTFTPESFHYIGAAGRIFNSTCISLGSSQPSTT